MNYRDPEVYRQFADREMRETIRPAVSAKGTILAAVHLGSTVTAPPDSKIWLLEISRRGNKGHQVDISHAVWGYKGPNDIDLAVIYDGPEPDALRRHYWDIWQKRTNDYVSGRVPVCLEPILETRFYSRKFVEELIAQTASGKQGAAKIHQDFLGPYTVNQKANRALIRLVEFSNPRYMGSTERDAMHLAGLASSESGQLRFIDGQGYAEEVAGRLKEAFWPSEINAMRGEKEGRKRYMEMALAKAAEEAGELPVGGTMLKLDIVSHDSMMAYWRLRMAAEIKDAYGNACRLFVDDSDRFADMCMAREVAASHGKDLMSWIAENRSYPHLHIKPEEVERRIKDLPVFFTPEEFGREMQAHARGQDNLRKA